MGRRTTLRPTRREILKYSSAMAASTVLASAFPGKARALDRSGLAGSGDGGAVARLHPSPLQPSPAAEFGFHRLTFSDDFLSPATIDAKNTLAPGFQWYMANAMIPQDSPDGTMHTGVVQSPSSVSVANSVLTFTPSAKSGGWLTNVGYKGASAPRTVGTPIAATGGYFECRMAFDPNFRPAASFVYPFQYWPAFWIEDIDLWLAINDRDSARDNKPELDFFEYFSRSIGYGMDMHDWTNNIHSAGLIPSIANASFGSPVFQRMNTFGTLWVPQRKNGGTGIVHRYFNGKHIAAANVNYSSTTTSPQAAMGFPGVFSDMDTSAGFVLQIGSGHGWAIHVDYVRVWQ
jgi:hypothetical protein